MLYNNMHFCFTDWSKNISITWWSIMYIIYVIIVIKILFFFQYLSDQCDILLCTRAASPHLDQMVSSICNALEANLITHLNQYLQQMVSGLLSKIHYTNMYVYYTHTHARTHAHTHTCTHTHTHTVTNDIHTTHCVLPKIYWYSSRESLQ